MNKPVQSDESVLIPAGNNGATYQCIRSLGRRGIPVIGVTDRRIPAFASKYCDEVLSVPSPLDDVSAYRDALLRIVTQRDVSTVIPCQEADVYLLSKYRDRFEEHVSLVIPSLERLAVVHDRLRLVRDAAEAGVPTPETRLLGDITDWSAPSIIKSRYNLLTADYIDAYPSDTIEEARTIVHPTVGERPNCEAIQAEMNHDPIIQEFVEKRDEYVFGALYDHGEPLVTFQHKQIRGDSYIGGGGVYRESVFIEELETVARTLLGQLDWHGLACIEYIEDVNTGEFKFIEINPRMWQSLPAAVRAGADFPYYYWLHATGQTDHIEPRYEIGVGCHRLKGELGHLKSIRQDESPHIERPSFYATLWDVLRSCVEQPHFDLLHLDDPRPFSRSAQQYLSSG